MFKKFLSFLGSIIRRPEARAVLSSWERVFNEQRSQLLIEMAVKAKPMITALIADKQKSGSEKRAVVVDELTKIFSTHTAALKAGITEATLKDIALLAAQQQYVVLKLDK